MPGKASKPGSGPSLRRTSSRLSYGQGFRGTPDILQAGPHRLCQLPKLSPPSGPLGLSPSSSGREHTFSLCTGQKLLLCFPLGSAHPGA